MLTISRSVLRRFRALCRRGGLHKCRTGSGGPTVTFIGEADGLRVRCNSPDIAIEYRQVGPCDGETIRLALDALETCEGRDDSPVTIEARSGNRAVLSWIDRGVPRMSEQEQPKADSAAFPVAPTTFIPNEPGLWSALREAVAVTDVLSTRYALGCLHLRGRAGKIEATDGRQVLVQSGYRFDWDDDVLVPGSKLLGCTDLDLGEGVAVGRAGNWVALGVGHWLILLRAQEGRFPKLDDLLPNTEAAKSELELSAGDALFLSDTLPRLPCDDEQHDPVTLDLNGEVLVRSRESGKGRPTEVLLTKSKLTGEPVLLITNRCYVERALKLGFHNVCLYGPDSPAMCADERRRYLWALLDKQSAIKRTDDAVRIESTAASPPSVVRPHKETSMSTPESITSPVAAPKIAPRTKSATPKNAGGSPIEQTLVLRDALRTAARQANDLLRSLKRQKRQSRIVESTLASLKQLQKVAG